MLKVPRASLIGIAKSELDAQQAVINGKATYPEKVDAAKALWKGRKSVTFTSVRELLAIICPGAQRCHYCEDSAADEVEHVWPKSLFPEKTFIWSNYVYACGQCNGAYKGDQFAVLTALGQSVELKRPRNAAIVPPVLGFPLFIDPVVDDPLDFLELDVLTGIFVPIAPPGSVNYMRAEYTIGVLGLNDRDFLSSA